MSLHEGCLDAVVAANILDDLHNDVPVEQVAHQQPGPVAQQVRFPMGWRFLVASLVDSFDVRVAHALVDD